MLTRGRRRLNRYREIAGVLARHGWGWMLESVGLIDRLKGKTPIEPQAAAPVHLREALEELGPTFVKLGQILSSRPDIVPRPFAAELSKLQDTAPTLPVKVIYQVIDEEFGVPASEAYGSFDPEPVAAASLAQVHQATLRDGTPVIVKVQRPDIREVVETDIEILYRRAEFLESHWERARTYGAADIVDEFAITIREEMDYTREGRNTDKLREDMEKVPGVHVPLVYWDFTTSRVLTLETLYGVKVTETSLSQMTDLDRKEARKTLSSAFLEQVFVNGYFHADPHPGNVLVTPGGGVGLLDCGQVGRLNSEDKEGAIRLLIAFEKQDARRFADEVIDLGIGETEVDVRRLAQDLTKVLRSNYDVPSRAMNMGEVLTRVLEVSADHRIRLPVSFAVLGKVFTTVDALCTQLDPEFNFTRSAREYVGKAVRNELTSERLVGEFYRSAASLRRLIFGLPESAERLLRKVIEGTMRVEFKHLGLEGMVDELRTAANRIAIALIVSGGIVGSSLVVVAGRGPTSVYGLPILGVVGYLVALIFGIWLVVSILRSGRKR